MDNKKIIICIGTGGVGKTSVASALALKHAQEGKKVLVLTIDPSKRLKTTMGISEEGEPVRVHIESLQGELYACVVNAKQTFDEFVRRAAVSDKMAERLLENKLYKQLSTGLSGSQEFTALEKLYSSYLSEKYDLIVLDTPPAQHAIDFLNAPQKLSALFNEQIVKWFQGKAGPLSIFQMGTMKVLDVLEKLTGSEFMAQLADFFNIIEGWRDRLEQRTADVHRLLTGSETQFVLVTASDHAKLMESLWLIKEIRKSGYKLNTVIVNRAAPSWILEGHPLQTTDEIQMNYLKLQEQRDAEQKIFASQLPSDVEIRRLPELELDVSSLDSVTKLAETMK